MFDFCKNILVGIFIKRLYKKHFANNNFLNKNCDVDLQNILPNFCQDLLKFANSNPSELLLYLKTSMDGLTAQEVTKRYHTYGYNQINKGSKPSLIKHVWQCYNNPFNLLLSVLTFISLITHDIPGTIVIAIMIIVSTILRFVQETRSNIAADKLKDMVSNDMVVHRIIDGIKQQLVVPIKTLVPGDIIAISAGDMIPADIRILYSKDLFVSQASMTGESLPVEKFTTNKSQTDNITDLSNIGFMGTNCISGTAIAVVITTGSHTVFGSCAKKIIEQKFLHNTFYKNINKLSWTLISFMLIMIPIIFIINFYTKNDWLSAFLFAVSIAVGMTPEMLPVIVTSTLAKGAVTMSRQKVIVKRLDAIQDFGAMDILCTDKTGTLTQDKICLERHIDIFGNECDEVLQYAYLNSYYQTGLKNLLDNAVLTSTSNFSSFAQQFSKIDEIPFDFQRRRMSVIVANDTEHILICKGAVDEMLCCCSHVLSAGQVMPLTTELLKATNKITNGLNTDGMRVVAVATKKYAISTAKIYSVADEDDMILAGYIAFLDPPKETASAALRTLEQRGIKVKILTGDNELVTGKICRDVNLAIHGVLLDHQINLLNDTELARIAEDTTVFAKLTPDNKERIVRVLRESGHIVGFMGDGINDAAALRAADIGISVDNAVDIAKEAADIVLLEKNLMVLESGVEEGRKTFANMLKYIKMTASSNFGNVLSVLIASAFLPFEPMLPIHILIQNLLYDISQIAIPFDNIDEENIMKPQTFNPNQLRQFMLFFGPLSSIFDIATFYVLWYVYHADTTAKASIFQSGWFVEGLITQIMIVHMIRTKKISFIQSMASAPLIATTTIIVIIGMLIPNTSISHYVKMHALPASYFIWIGCVVASYMLLVQLMKKIYIKLYGWQ